MIHFPEDGPAPRACVLCVDDNPDIADTEAMLLVLLGFDARSCYGGRDALALARTFRPSVCLLDMNMPGMDGDELAARLHHQAGGRPLLLIAVTAMTTDACRDRTRWFDLHLFKPVEPDKLLAAVVTPPVASTSPGQGGRVSPSAPRPPNYCCPRSEPRICT